MREFHRTLTEMSRMELAGGGRTSKRPVAPIDQQEKRAPPVERPFCLREQFALLVDGLRERIVVLRAQDVSEGSPDLGPAPVGIPISRALLISRV